jgi:hypothetical protein
VRRKTDQLGLIPVSTFGLRRARGDRSRSARNIGRLLLLFNQQHEQHITLGFVRFSSKQPTEASNVLAADESLKSLVMFRCRTIHGKAFFSLGLWFGSVFDGLDATPPFATPPFAPQSYDVHVRERDGLSHSRIASEYTYLITHLAQPISPVKHCRPQT